MDSVGWIEGNVELVVTFSYTHLSTSEVRTRCWLIKPESFILKVKDGVEIRALFRPDNFSDKKKEKKK